MPEKEDIQDIFDIIFTMRAMRRLSPEPVPRACVEKILRAGQAAPSGGNSQSWRFIVVTDKAIMREVQVYYKRAYDELSGPHYAAKLIEADPGEPKEKLGRQISAVEYLTDHIHECPVWIVACSPVGDGFPEYLAGASIYPAVQNMLLAARALGLGSTLTLRHTAYSEEVNKILGVPSGFRSFALLPIGYPLGKFGPVRRGPLSECVYGNRWGEPWDSADL